MERIELMKKETFKKTAAALLVATTVSSGIFSVKTTEVKASISTQTALKNLNKAKAEDLSRLIKRVSWWRIHARLSQVLSIM